MSEPIENEYFNWLCAKVLDPNTRNYIDLLRILHQTEFIVVVPLDRHRAQDGIELRLDFRRELKIRRDFEWEDQPCSIFELLVSFSYRAAFQTNISLRDWFWIFMTNLNLSDYRQVSHHDMPIIEDILSTFIWRTYDPSGFGGMFPLSQTRNDQRKIEIWYQFCEYLDDQRLL